MKGLKPDWFLSSFEAISAETLDNYRIRGLLLDIDNTLAPYHLPSPSEAVMNKLSELREKGFLLCIISNGREERVRSYAAQIGCEAVSRAGKPFGKGISLASELLGLSKKEMAVVGDQLFTDIWAGRLNHCFCILIKPISLVYDEKITKWKRPFERLLIRLWKIEAEDRHESIL